ncbi:MAG: hypothetical protein JWP52_42, partial [Rhizobacter sp.]|nr:hypothetical protein [Rhizobacter sp.]
MDIAQNIPLAPGALKGLRVI